MGRADRQFRPARGLCVRCPAPPEPDKTLCKSCLGKQAIYRNKKKAAGQCACGSQPEPGHGSCFPCRKQKWEANRKLRDEVIAAYGGPRCVCCGETTPEFLQLDHTNNDGGEHRKAVGTGARLYVWLRKHGFPPGFQVLCANCNYAKGQYGRCPHHPEKVVNAAVAAIRDRYVSAR